MVALLQPAPPGGARLLGLGSYLPARSVGNDEFAARLDTDDGWIRTRVGVSTRRYAGSESVADMAVDAAGKALAAAGAVAADLDLVLLASCTLPSAVPGRAAEVATRLGARAAGALDVNGACAGFCYGLAIAADAVRSGSARQVLVVGSERLTDWVDHGDRATAPIFGDGAGAAVVGPATHASTEIGPPAWGHDGSNPSIIEITRADPHLRMAGPAVYRWAIGLAPVARRACALAGIEPADLVAFVPHQANLRIVDALAAALQVPHVAVARDIVECGNTSAASVPIALSRLVERGQVRRGDPVLLLAFGAGLTYAGQVVRTP